MYKETNESIIKNIKSRAQFRVYNVFKYSDFC